MIGTPSFFYGYLKRSQPGDFSSVRIAVAGADKLTVHLREGYKNTTTSNSLKDTAPQKQVHLFLLMQRRRTSLAASENPLQELRSKLLTEKLMKNSLVAKKERSL